MNEELSTAEPNDLDDRARRQLVWSVVLVNLIALALMPGLSIEKGFSVPITVGLTGFVVVICNGALWLGWRNYQARLKAKRPLKPLLFFALAVLGAVSAILDLTSGEYGSAVFGIGCCVSMLGLGLIIGRNNAAKDAGGPNQL
jgi:peptidoglycan/LPS O-acetylase OafA/YrhL